MKDTLFSSPVIVVCMVLCLLLAGCTGGPSSRYTTTPPPLVAETTAGAGASVTTAPAAGGGCAEGQTVCGGVCRNTLADPGNCGRCSNICSTLQYCSNGICTAGTMVIPSTVVTTGLSSSGISCAEGQTVCSGICRNTVADASNCGMCGRVCSSGQVCSSGSCSAGAAPAAVTSVPRPLRDSAPDGTTTTPAGGAGTCFPDQLNCGGTCFERNDPNNCGSCGNVCPSWQICSSGTCRDCGAGFTRCGEGCSNTSIDPVNCGGCGNSCSPDLRCIAGSCVAGISGGTFDCGAGFTRCGEGCSNTSIDPVNCGSCGNACPAGLRCIGGTCYADMSGLPLINTCLVGYTDCGSGCTDLQSDPANCGSCGYACPSGQVCLASVCMDFIPVIVTTAETPACPKFTTACPFKGTTTCVDLNTDSNNCGYCGHVCTTGSCSGGTCGFTI